MKEEIKINISPPCQVLEIQWSETAKQMGKVWEISSVTAKKEFTISFCTIPFPHCSKLRTKLIWSRRMSRPLLFWSFSFFNRTYECNQQECYNEKQYSKWSVFQSKYKHLDVKEKLLLVKGASMTYEFCHVISSKP